MNNALLHGASASAPWCHDVASVADASVATDAGNAAGLGDAHAVTDVAAAGGVASPARSVNTSNSSDSEDSNMIGEDCADFGCQSTGLTDFTNSPLPEEDYFSADGDDIDEDDMPTDAEASKYSFLDRLEHYLERALITDNNCKAVELAIMVEVGTTVKEMDPMKKEVKEKAFLNSYVSITNQESGSRYSPSGQVHG